MFDVRIHSFILFRDLVRPMNVLERQVQKHGFSCMVLPMFLDYLIRPLSKEELKKISSNNIVENANN